MTRSIHWAFVLSLLGALACCDRAWAVIAMDDASNAPYNDGWQVNDNGGSGFDPWSIIGRENGSGSGGGFIANNHAASQINTGSPPKAFGIFGNGGGVGHAIRPFDVPLSVGQAFFIDMDNQGIDTGATVGFGLRNSSNDNLVEFFFVGGQSNYRVNRAGGSVDSGVGFTQGGIRLQLTLTDADSFSLTIDALADAGAPTVVTGDLISAAGGQVIDRLRLFNANGGPDVYFNNFLISAVPEASAVWFGVLACGAAALVFCCRRTKSRSLPQPAE